MPLEEKRKRDEGDAVVEKRLRLGVYVQNRRHSTSEVRDAAACVVDLYRASHVVCDHREGDANDPCALYALDDVRTVPCFYASELAASIGVTPSWTHKMTKKLYESLRAYGCQCHRDAMFPRGDSGRGVPLFYVPFLFDSDAFRRAGTCKAACEAARQLLLGDAPALEQLDCNERMVTRRKADPPRTETLLERLDAIEKRVAELEQRTC
jgi:hypothetical protein